MGTEKGVHLEVDEYKRMDISNVITMLKGLRSEAVIKIVKTSETKEVAGTENFIHDDGKFYVNNSTLPIYKPSAVTGKTDLPQIRELNEIASLLRSMDSQQKQLGS